MVDRLEAVMERTIEGRVDASPCKMSGDTLVVPLSANGAELTKHSLCDCSFRAAYSTSSSRSTINVDCSTRGQ